MKGTLSDPDEADLLVYNDLQKKVDATLKDFLANEVIVDSNRRRAMLLLVLAHRTLRVEMALAQAGVPDDVRNEVWNEARKQLVMRQIEKHLHTGCSPTCTFADAMQRFDEEIAARHGDVESRAAWTRAQR